LLRRRGAHPHKHLISLDDLKAGSAFAIGADQYPLQVRAAANACALEAWGLEIEIDHV
jgi:hypothetical protein